MRANFRLVRSLFGSARSVAAAGTLSAAGQTVLLVPVGLLVRRTFDHSIPTGDRGEVISIGVAILALYVASALLGWFSRRVIVRICKESVGRLRAELIAHLYSLPREWHDQRRSAELHATVVNDSERLDYIVGLLARTVAPAAILAAALAVVALVIAPLLFAIMAAFLVPLIVAGRWLARSSRRLTRLWLDAFKGFSANTHLALRAMMLTSVHAAESWEHERQARQIDDVTRAGRRLDAAQASHSAMQGSLAAAAGTALLVVGGLVAIRHQISLGSLLAFYAVAMLMLRQFALIGPGLAAAGVATESFTRLAALLDSRVESPYSGVRDPRLKGAVRFEGVTFGYGTDPVVEEISFSVEPGEHVALVGPSGSGKSTLASLLLGLYRPQVGRLLFDGVPLSELDVRGVRRQIGVVLQDPILFPGTVAQNIAYGRPGAELEDLVEAARWGMADEFIRKLPQGYETQVGDEGVLLSGGQAQRVAIARALLGRAPVLVLDEPTTNLDEPTIQLLMDSLDELPHSPTVILITHDHEVAARADRIIHLRDGRIALIEPGERDRRPATV